MTQALAVVVSQPFSFCSTVERMDGTIYRYIYREREGGGRKREIERKPRGIDLMMTSVREPIGSIMI
jgi:hypothetical protein